LTEKKQLKAAIRARMAKTGERYTTARAHVVGTDGGAVEAPAVDHGYALRGGAHPDSAGIANLLANLGVTAATTGAPLSEPMVFGIGGGLGAGYILWEFAEHGTPDLVLGFRNQWQYTNRWVEKVFGRVGVPVEVHHTGGAKGAASRLTETLARGRPGLIWPDRQLAGYWHLPPHLNGRGGNLVVAYAERDGRVHLDDRNLRPLTVEREALDAARARVVSYRNALFVPDPDGAELPAATVRQAVRVGIAECVEHLRGASTSFSLPAWRKWARLLTDTRAAKGWPRVFADRAGLAGALLSTWEGIEPAGMSGGNLRGLYAEFLDEAAGLLGDEALAGCAGHFRAAAAAWHDLAEVALPAAEPVFTRLRERTAAVTEAVVAEGDGGREQAAAAAAELWELRARHDHDLPLAGADVDRLFAEMSGQLVRIHALEVEAVERLGDAVRADGGAPARS
jgi:hypothetical protein